MTAGLVLGTVQFGQAYGVANAGGRVSEAECGKILQTAARLGVKTLDTAPAYGESEIVLGRLAPKAGPFRIITKTPTIRSLAEALDPAYGIAASLEQSLENLGQDRVGGLLVHNLHAFPDEDADKILEELFRLRDAGKTNAIGLSLYDPDELGRFGNLSGIDLVQLPINLLDQRFSQSGCIERLKIMGIEVHARSVFLQGLLLMPPDRTPEYFDPIRNILRTFHEDAKKAGLPPLDAALGFVAGQAGIDGMVVGVDTHRQLEEIAGALEKGKIDDVRGYACDSSDMIDPRRWPAL